MYKVEFREGAWQTPENLGPQINTEGNELFPFIHQDKQLYFASNGHGGLGGLDVFGIDFSLGNTAKVVNVGVPLNSQFDDFGVIFNSAGTEGYFSSNRPGGKGNDDVYAFTASRSLLTGYMVSGKVLDVSDGDTPLYSAKVLLLDGKGNVFQTIKTGADGSYSFELKPEENYQLKVQKDDYLEAGRKFVARRADGPDWNFDLYVAKKQSYSLYAIIRDEKTAEVLQGVQVMLFDNIKEQPVLEKTTDGAGDFLYSQLEDKKPGDKVSFQVKLTKKGYLSKTFTYNAVLQQPAQIKLHDVLRLNLNKIAVGMDVGELAGVQPIYFDLGKFTIRPDAARELDKIVLLLKENPNIEIELGSHTDARGSGASNLALSDKRAKASASYIISKGIASSRIVGKGYGESEIKNRCADGVSCSEEEHQQNRRTEFMVTKF